MQLDPRAAARGVRLIVADTLGSTNAEALARARDGERGPLWITARRQTAGRGRRGRNWVSPPGNLYATLLLVDPSSPERAAELSFVAALAVHDAVIGCAHASDSMRAPARLPLPAGERVGARGLGPFDTSEPTHPDRTQQAARDPTCPPRGQVTAATAVPSDRIKIKWPNDLLIDGAKFAGILVEGESMAGAPLAVAIGVGVNCSTHPQVDYAVTDLAQCGVSVSPEALLERLSATMLQRLDQWGRGAGFDATRRDWLVRADGIGHEIAARTSDRTLHGRFETVDAAGSLVLRLPDGSLQTVRAGEIMPLADAATQQRAPA